MQTYIFFLKQHKKTALKNDTLKFKNTPLPIANARILKHTYIVRNIKTLFYDKIKVNYFALKKRKQSTIFCALKSLF